MKNTIKDKIKDYLLHESELTTVHKEPLLAGLLEEALAEIERLEEYEWKYKGLCK